jgi:hypothetical protein
MIFDFVEDIPPQSGTLSQPITTSHPTEGPRVRNDMTQF